MSHQSLTKEEWGNTLDWDPFHLMHESLHIFILGSLERIKILFKKVYKCIISLLWSFSFSICIIHQKSAILLKRHQNIDHWKLSSIHRLDNHCLPHQEYQQVKWVIDNTPFNVKSGEMHARVRILEKNHQHKLLELERALDQEDSELICFTTMYSLYRLASSHLIHNFKQWKWK